MYSIGYTSFAMAFVDQLDCVVTAGKGGNGVVRWRHEKGKEFSGPSGGNGGKGGDVYAVAVRDIGILARYQRDAKFKAGSGNDGFKDSKQGKSGDDFELSVPIGSVIQNRETGEVYELLGEGDRVMLAKGGRGGLGNEHFKSSINTRPEEQTNGELGESFSIHIELQIIADAGLVGLPNAGKSSLLNVLTRAGAKVGDYAFTTLSPNLGDCFGYIIADIPGLIEGAAEGKGLGHEFLRHIKRTKVILHCVGLDNQEPLVSYTTVRDELAAYDQSLATKPELIILTKADVVTKNDAAKVSEMFVGMGKAVVVVSIIDDVSIKVLRDSVVSFIREYIRG